MPVNVQGGALEFDAVIRNTDFKKQIDQMEARLLGLTKTANQQADAVENYARKVSVAVGGYISLTAGTTFLQDIVTVRGEFQKLEVSFKTMLQSKERADALMQQAVELAAKTPFTLQEVGDGAKQLLAYGFAAENTVETLRMLGNVASGVGAPLNDIVYLYGTLQTQGRAYTKDIMQFTGRGIPIIEELAKIYGVAKNEVQALVEAGKVGFPEVEQAFKAMTNQGGLFFNLMEEQSKTLTGQISNLEDAWSRMLNDIGKEKEGVLSALIVGATEIVDNYQDVVDILKVMVATYGSYRTALIALSVVEGVQASMVKGYTLLETLRFRAMVLSEGAMKLLNKTMLSNPAVALTTVLAALISTLVIFGKETDKATKAQEAINEVSSEARKKFELEKNKLQELIKVASDETRSKVDREKAIRRINEISPEYLGNISLETIKTKEGQKAIEDYIAMLDKKAEAQAVQSKLDELFKQKLDEEIKLSQVRRDSKGRAERNGFLDIFAGFGLGEGSEGFKFIQAQKRIETLNTTIDLVRSKYKDVIEKNLLGEDQNGTNVKSRTLAVIDEEIKALQDLQKKSVNAKQYQDVQKKINDLEKERIAITGQSKKQAEAENKVLNERKGLLEQIQDLVRESNRSGLVNEQSELDKINEKYDNLFKKIAEFNKKNPTNKIGQLSVNQLSSARVNELENANQKQSFELFKEDIEKRKSLFQQYEEAKVSIGKEQADKLFKTQLGSFEAFSDFLASQKDLYDNMLMSGDTSIGTQLRLNEIIKQGIDLQNKEASLNFEKQVKDIEALISSTQSINDRRIALERKYQSDLALLRKQFAGDELKRREQELSVQFSKENQALDSESASKNPFVVRLQLEAKYLQDAENLRRDFRGKELQEKLDDLSVIYQKQAEYIAETYGTEGEAISSFLNNLNQFTISELESYIQSLKELVQRGTIISDGVEVKIPPEILAQLQEYIRSLELVSSGSKKMFGMTANGMKEFNKYADLSRQAFSDLSQQVAPLNQGLADTLATVNDLVTSAQGLANVGIGILLSDPIQIVKGAMQLISGIISIFNRSRESQKKARAEMIAFQNKILEGEIQTNILYRERERSQIRLNQLKLDGIKKESDALRRQATSNAAEYKRIMDLISREQFIAGQTTRRRGGFLGIGRVTEVVNQMQSLSGLNYNQLEQLFNSGQLNERAKELFQTLQKLKQDGLDIEQAIENLKKESQEVFTATTTDAIVNSLIEGFKQGKKSAEDFADSFEELMQGAILNALKFQTLEKPLQDFYTQFANLSESGSTLTAAEIEQLRKQYNDIVNNASRQFENLRQISGINFGNIGSNQSSLSGAIKGISEQQANLLAGQFGGLRITALEQLQTSRQALDRLNEIANNTASIYQLHSKWDLMGLKIK